MKAWVYDIESYPNFFCITFRNLETSEKVVFIIDHLHNQRLQIIDFVRGKWLIGYNNHGYDDYMLNYIIERDPSVGEIKVFSNRIINSDNPYIDPSLKIYKYSRLYKSIDLIRLLFAKMLRVGLKELQVTMKWKNVKEIPYFHENILSEQEKLEVIEYNDNDVLSTRELAIKTLPDIKLRHSIKQKFGLECYSKDGVRTGVDLFLKLYCQATGEDENVVKNLRSPREFINLGEIISDKVKFNSSKFKQLLEELKNTTISETRGSLDKQVLYGGVMHVFGTGGIHSKDPAGIIIPKPGYRYMDADVASLYPSILIQYGFKPEHLKDEFLTVYKFLRDDRVRAKRAGESLIADTYKLSLNGLYGNLISEHSWAYDPKAAMGITLNGQLFLSMLSEQLIDAGIQVDSLNTDGITALVKEDQMDTYWAITKNWQELTNLELEFKEYSKVIRRNVNSYYAIYKDDKEVNGKDAGKIKEKGDLGTGIVLGKGFDKPIVKIAVRDYFTKGIPIEQTIRNHKDIYDFTMFQKVGKQFEVEWWNKKQQRINRYYASKRGAYIYKVKGEGSKKKMSHMLKGVGVQIFNEYVEKSMEDYQIDYQYYIIEARKLINEIETNQLNMFENE